MFWLDLVLYDFFIMLVWGRCRIFLFLGPVLHSFIWLHFDHIVVFLSCKWSKNAFQPNTVGVEATAVAELRQKSRGQSAAVSTPILILTIFRPRSWFLFLPSFDPDSDFYFFHLSTTDPGFYHSSTPILIFVFTIFSWWWWGQGPTSSVSFVLQPWFCFKSYSCNIIIVQ